MADRPAQLHNLNGKQARELAENFLINAEAIGLFERRPALAIDEQIEEPLLFDSQSTGGRGGFTLTGYANGPGHGFADYRYKLKDAVTLNQIASEIVKILINDEYHRENLTLSNFRINQDLLNLVLEE